MTPRIFLECFVITKVNNPVFFSEARCGNYKSISFPKVSMSRTIVMPNLDLFLWDFFLSRRRHMSGTKIFWNLERIINNYVTWSFAILQRLWSHWINKNGEKFVKVCVHFRSLQFDEKFYSHWFWWFSKDSLFIQKVRLFYCRKKFYLAKRNRNALSNAEPQ